jgi:Holliday junction resolvase RusA-like endonuclease
MCRNGHVYNPDTADAWKERIILAITQEYKPPVGGMFPKGTPVAVEMEFWMPCPKKIKTKQDEFVTTKPDLDNMEKAVLDALTTAGVWYDDAQVAKVAKLKARNLGVEPGMHLLVYEATFLAVGTMTG